MGSPNPVNCGMSSLETTSGQPDIPTSRMTLLSGDELNETTKEEQQLWVFVDDFLHAWWAKSGSSAIRDRLHLELGKRGLPPLKCSRLTEDSSFSFLGLDFVSSCHSQDIAPPSSRHTRTATGGRTPHYRRTSTTGPYPKKTWLP